MRLLGGFLVLLRTPSGLSFIYVLFIYGTETRLEPKNFGKNKNKNKIELGLTRG